MIFENTHEPIIDLDTWERVQELRKNKRRPTKTGKTNMFSTCVLRRLRTKDVLLHNKLL